MQQNRHSQEEDEKKKKNLTLSKWNTIVLDQRAEISGRIHTSHLD